MNWINYLIQSNLFLAVFYGFYWLVLRRETFNTNNRIYLVGSALLSFAIPFLNSELVRSWLITKETSEIIYSYELSDIIIQNQQTEHGPDLLKIISVIYGIGALLFLMRFAVRVFRLSHLLRSDNPAIRAFSFFNRIFVDEELQENDTIFEHELVHARQAHSFDVMFFEFLSIICWFNPFIYFYKVSVKNIHEFIADEVASSHLPSKADYALLLFSQQFQAQPGSLINTFFDKPTLKLRIQMLKKKRSAKVALLKYGLIVPLFTGMLILTSATIASDANLSEISLLLQNEGESRVVRGKVSDAVTGQSLPGANIVVKNGNKGTSTDVNGKFAIDLNDKENTLVVSFVGYGTVEVSTESVSYLEISLRSEGIQLPQTVVVGKPAEASSEEVFSAVEVNPEFPGGSGEMFRYIGDNIKYPAPARRASVSGKVFLKFIVEKDGSVGGIQVLKGIGFGCDEEAVRVVASMPKWKPGVQNGKPVRVHYNIPIQFEIEGQGEKKNTGLLLKPSTETFQEPARTAQGANEEYYTKPDPAGQPKNATTVHGTLKSVTIRSKEDEKPVTFKAEGPANVVIVGYGRQGQPDISKDVMVILDGKEVPYSKLKEIEPNDIESISVLKDQKAVEKFGEKAVKGVIEIRLK